MPPYTVNHIAVRGQHETGTQALTMAWKAPNRVRRVQGSEGNMLVMLCSPKGTLLEAGVAVEGGERRCNLARLSGGAEPVHGGSWSFGLGGVSHVGGDATAREIFPRLGGSQRPLPFWVAFGCGHDCVHHLALRMLGG